MTSNRYPPPRDPMWPTRAVCDDPELMAPREDDARGVAEARRICGNCPVRQDCLNAAMREEGSIETHRRDGVRGGLTPAERYSVHRMQQRPTKKTDQPKPCGTPAAYRRHLAHSEAPCDACHQAMVDEGRERRGAKSKAGPDKAGGGSEREPISHGTRQGAYQHRNRGEQMCDPCRDAYNAYHAELRRKKRAEARGGPVKTGPAPIVHGTVQGANAHKNRKIPLCDPCRKVYNARQREYQAKYRAAKRAKAVGA